VAQHRALVVGATGITGRNTSEHLADLGWEVFGISRSAAHAGHGVTPVSVDVLNADAVDAAIRGLSVTHLFFCTWSRQDTEARNIEVNGAMLRNVVDAVGRTGTLQHAALVTGLKHYLGPFEAYGKNPAKPPYRESQERLEYENFYYEQEDILFAAADRFGFTWSVHRPHTVIGFALGNAMNMGVTLAIYGTLARATGRPFVFPGSPEQYEGTTDVTDARLLARQLAWAATDVGAKNEAFNIVNGETFHWRDMWQVVASGLGVEPAPYPGKPTPLVEQMVDAAEEWRRVAEQHGLVQPDVEQLASWWHTDADLGRTMETYADMTKSREAGFRDTQDTRRSFLDLFDRLRQERVIPSLGEGKVAMSR
jgi:nucleoside-diphosphate-sugar epimerase